jgi:hypothetical protein
MLNPTYPAAVVAGNVETSTCVTNALYGALGVMAAGPCTMNNFTFGNARHQYYETISGGSGAGPGFHGTEAIPDESLGDDSRRGRPITSDIVRLFGYLLHETGPEVLELIGQFYFFGD